MWFYLRSVDAGGMHHLPQDQSDLHVRLHCADLSVRNLRSLRYTIFQLLKYHFNHSPAIHFLAIEFVPRLCQIRKWPGFPSYGFDLQPLETTKGQGHYIGRVLPGSPAQDAGLLYGDRIVEVNGINVENETIQKVAQRIDPASSETTLLVVDRVTDQLFKDQSTRISSAMPWLKKTATRPRVLSKLSESLCVPNPRCKPHLAYFMYVHIHVSSDIPRVWNWVDALSWACGNWKTRAFI